MIQCDKTDQECFVTDCGYGGRFYDWMFRTDSKPYGSYGNGSAMRVACSNYSNAF